MTARLGYRMRNSLLGLLRTAGMCCALLFLQQTAHADLWAFVDERGVTWYKISYNGASGWVSSRYCELH